MILDFTEQRIDFINMLEKSKIGVLATSYKNIVKARSMSIVNIDEVVLFQTDKRMEKYFQITKNENVAICINNIQIEGKAKLKGKADRQTIFIEIFRKKHEGSYKAYSKMNSEVVIEIHPMRVKIWEYIENEPYIRTIDFENKNSEITKYIKD